MNYENVYGYLCFCCADAVDCGVEGMSCVDWGFVLDDGYGVYKVLDSSLCSE